MKDEMIAWLVSLGLPTLLQLSPLKINPWSWVFNGFKWLWRAFCRSLNADVLEELASVRQDLRDTKNNLDNHIKLDDEREADKVRADILRFNNELFRGQPHTEEEFVEVLYKIDWYNEFCKNHTEYKNSRAVHAIANINRVYLDPERPHNF